MYRREKKEKNGELYTIDSGKELSVTCPCGHHFSKLQHFYTKERKKERYIRFSFFPPREVLFYATSGSSVFQRSNVSNEEKWKNVNNGDSFL